MASERDEETASDSGNIMDLLGVLGIGVIGVDNETGLITKANAALAQIFGFASVEDVIGHNVLDSYADPKERAEAIARLLSNPEVRRTGIVRLQVQRIHHQTGAPVHVLMSLRLTFTEDGSVSAIDGIVQDVGDAKRAAREFAESEQRFHRVFEDAALGMILTDPDGLIMRVNPAFCSFMGMDEMELLQRDVSGFIETDGEKAALLSPETDSDVTGRDYCFQRPDGEGAWGYVNLSWLRDEDGNPHTAVIMVQDVTQRKRTEEALSRIEKLESLAVLAGGIAHDFNNVLTAILGNLSLLELGAKKNARALDLIGAARLATVRAGDMTTQLLTFSRGGAPIRRLANMAEQLADIARFALQGSAVREVLDIAPDLHPAEYDPGQISQALSNLILNAAQSMPSGGVVEISARNTIIDSNSGIPLPRGPYLALAVADNGTGIPPEHLDRIFDPYFSTKSSGSGLGLATAHSIVRRHNGHIEVTSELGRGTKFVLYLPASAGAEAPPPPMTDTDALSSLHGRVLLMDDEPMVRGIAKSILTELGLDVDLVKDGKQALSAYEEAQLKGVPYSAVVLDLTVPGGMGGMEALAGLRELDPNVRAIVSSGYSVNPILSSFRDHGFVGAILKPYDARTVHSVLNQALAEPRSPAYE